MTNHLRYKNLMLFCGLLALTEALILLTNHYLLTIDFYERSGQSVAANPQSAASVYTLIQPYIYVASTIYLMLKLAAIILIIQTAFFLSGKYARLDQIVHVVLSAEYLFFIPAILKIYLFRHYFPEGTLQEWHRFYVLSALSLFPEAGAVWIYPLQTLNVFEIAYWFILARGIYQLTDWSFDKALRLVLKSYIPALFLWILLISFGTLLIFPQTA